MLPFLLTGVYSALNRVKPFIGALLGFAKANPKQTVQIVIVAVVLIVAVVGYRKHMAYVEATAYARGQVEQTERLRADLEKELAKERAANAKDWEANVSQAAQIHQMAITLRDEQNKLNSARQNKLNTVSQTEQQEKLNAVSDKSGELVPHIRAVLDELRATDNQ